MLGREVSREVRESGVEEKSPRRKLSIQSIKMRKVKLNEIVVQQKRKMVSQEVRLCDLYIK